MKMKQMEFFRPAPETRDRIQGPGASAAKDLPFFSGDFFHCPEDVPCCFLGVRISRVAQWVLGPEKAVGFRTAKPFLWHQMTETGVFSEEEKNCFNAFSSRKRQIEWLAARFAAKLLVRKILAPRMPMARITIAKEEKGAPFLSSFPDYALSISHGGDWALCALCTEEGAKIGVDVEDFGTRDREALFRMAWSQREALFLAGASDKDVVRHWTRKEAVLKILGEGFHLPLKKVEVLPSGVYFAGKPCSGLTCRTFLPDPGHCSSFVYCKGPDFLSRINHDACPEKERPFSGDLICCASTTIIASDQKDQRKRSHESNP